MKKCGYIFIIIVSLFISSAFAFASEIRVGAGTTASASVLRPVEDPFEKATGINLTVTTYGSTAAFKALDQGDVDAVMGAHTKEEIIDILKKDGYEIKEPAAFQEIKIDEPKHNVVIVHRNNPVNSLTIEQLRGLFTGRINNWKEVGGADLPVTVVRGKRSESCNKAFEDQILNNEPWAGHLLSVNDVTYNVASRPEAIGYLPAALLDASVKAPAAPALITKPMNIFAKGKPSADIQALIEFIKGDGRKYIKK
ncbi:MAG: substrate-binding domain-containing protein [Nitrospirae bacterium]|nr:substrate-binding domain-containing protein [Nitrospirota bacterium]